MADACAHLRKCESMRVLLALVWSLGNLLNAGSKQGQAYGFKLSALTLLRGVKAANHAPTQSLLHFVARYLQAHFPHVPSLTQDLACVAQAARIESRCLGAEIRQLQQNLDLLTRTIKEAPKTNPELNVHSPEAPRAEATPKPADPSRISLDIPHKAVAMCDYASGRCATLQAKWDTTSREMEALMTYFGEDLMPWEDFFVMLRTFACDYRATEVSRITRINPHSPNFLKSFR